MILIMKGFVLNWSKIKLCQKKNAEADLVEEERKEQPDSKAQENIDHILNVIFRILKF